MSNNQIDKLEDIKEFSKLSTVDMYECTEFCKTVVATKESELVDIAYEKGLSIAFHPQDSTSTLFKKLHGFYLNTSRLFPSDPRRIFVWYKVKECIPEYYAVENAEIHPTHIKTAARLRPYEKDFKLALQREFKSGVCKYDVDDASLYLIHLVRTITENFKGCRKRQ